MSNQTGWRWCYKCQGLFFSGNPSQGVCPGGGSHDASQSGRYAPLLGDGIPGAQDGWRWCQKCQGLFFSLNPSMGVCPADQGAHDGSASGHYALQFGDAVPGTQGLWRWCQKCQGFFFSGNPSSACPAGGAHDGSASGQYGVPWEEIALQTGPIVFGGGVPVGGWAYLTVFPDGRYNFSGHFHDSGFPNYNANIVWALRSASGTVFTFSQSESLGGTLGGSRDGNWNLSGTNAAIASGWNDLLAGWNYQWLADASIDLPGLWNSIKGAIGTIAQVIAVVGPLFA